MSLRRTSGIRVVQRTLKTADGRGYFRAPERVRAIMMLLEYLNPGGYLFLTSAETLEVVVDGAKIVPFKDTLVYKRNQEAVNVQVHE